MSSHSWLKHLATVLIAFAMVGLFAVVTFNLSFMSPIAQALENFSFADLYFQMQVEGNNYQESQTITIVDMTKLRERRKIARLMDEVREQEPKTIGVDILFLGHRGDIEGDFMVEAAASRCAENAVFSYTLGEYKDNQFHKETHSFFASTMDLNEGFSGFQRDLYSDIKRTLCLGRPSMGCIRPSFPLMVANQYAEKTIFEAEDRDLFINFTPTHFDIIPYDSVEQYAHLLTDRIVLIGAQDNPEDQHYTPIGKISGVELIAYSIQTLLSRNEMKPVPLAVSLFITFILVLISELLQSAYLGWSNGLDNKWWKAMMSSDVALTVLTFCWLVILGLLFILFIGTTGYKLSLGWTMSIVVFLDVSRKFIDSTSELIHKES